MSRRPNIIFILADDMGYGDFGAVNGGLSSTPALDGLMREGVTFTQQYTASPVCNPSRAALLTGRYPHRTGSIDTLEWRGLERLALRERTLADMLKAAGYATGLVGKWHLGSFDPRYHPNRRGFDETVCFRGGMHDYSQWRLEYDNKVHRADGRYLTDVWSQEACEFVERHRAEPFFLHLTYNAPHTPLQAPDREVEAFLEREWERGVATIYGMIHRMDVGIGMLLSTLHQLGLAEDTIVFFTSDNGPQFGGEGVMSTTRFNCQLHGAKGSTYEGGIRVPMIVRWPAGLPAGAEIGEMVHFCDWLPTILAMAGVELPADNLPLDGRNVLPVLRGEPAEAEPRRFWQWNRYSPVGACNAGVRDGDWKLVRPAIREAMEVPDIHLLPVSMYRPEFFIDNGIIPGEPPREVPAPPPPELYNLASDPLEQENVADRHPDVAHRLVSALETWFEEVEADRRSIADEWTVQ